MVKWRLKRIKVIIRCTCPLWDAYEYLFKALYLNHKIIFAKKGVVWYLFTAFRFHFFQPIAAIYPYIHIDWWNIIKSPEKVHRYMVMIFNKGAKNTQEVKYCLFHIHMQKNEIGLIFYTIHKTVKHLEEKRWKLSWHWSWQWFLGQDIKP